MLKSADAKINDAEIDNAFTQVNTLKSGALRENSFYYYAEDYLDSELFSKSSAILRYSNTRNVVYCQFPCNSCESYPETSINFIFTGFKLIDYPSHYQRHLSIDKHTFYEHLGHVHEYSVAHATLVFENDTARYTAHVHYNRHGHMIQINVKSTPLDDVTRMAIPVPISQTQRDQLEALAMPCQRYLFEIIEAKQQCSRTLYDQSIELNQQLMEAHAASERDKTLQLAHELHALTTKISQYDDEKNDGRTRFLTQFINALINDSHIHSPSEKSILPNHDEETLLVLPPNIIPGATQKRRVQSSNPKDAPIQYMPKLDAIAHQMLEKPFVLNDAYARLWLEFDKLSRWIIIMGGESEARYVAQIRRTLPITSEMLDYFKERVKQRDIDAVQLLHPVIIEDADLSPIYTQFCCEIYPTIDGCVNNLSQKDIILANFFYAHSMRYRNYVYFEQNLRHASAKEGLACGTLLLYYTNNDLNGFKMMLSQGLSMIQAQFIALSPTMPQFDALQSIIIHYKANAYPERIQFLRELLQYKRNIISFDIINNPLIDQNSSLPSSKKNHGFFAHKQSRDISHHEEQTKLYNELSKIKNNLFLAIAVNRNNHPELIEELARFADIKQLLLTLSTLLSPRTESVTNYFIASTTRSNMHCFDNQNACEEAASKFGTGVCSSMLFVLNADAEENLAQTITNPSRLLMKSLFQKIARTPTDFRHLLNTFRDSIEQDSKNLTVLHFVDPDLCMAGQLAYSLIKEPTHSDHQMLLQIFAYAGKIFAKQRLSKSNCYYTEASRFLNALPEDDRVLLEKTPIAQHILKQISKHETKQSGNIIKLTTSG